jgi:hypothetical protein
MILVTRPNSVSEAAGSVILSQKNERAYLGGGGAGTNSLGFQRARLCLSIPPLLPHPRGAAAHRAHTDTGSPFHGQPKN